jgi:superfamily II DNA or RNA helicase
MALPHGEPGDFMSILQVSSVPSGRQVLLRKTGNMLDVSPDGRSPLPDELRRPVERLLTYTQKKFLYGAARYATGGDPRRVDTVEKRCFRYDSHGRLVCAFGFVYQLVETFGQLGYGISFSDTEQDRAKEGCYDLNMFAVNQHFTFRPRQQECLDVIANNPGGLIHAVTGFGKMAMIAMTCLMYSTAKIDIVTRRAPLVNKLSEYLTRYMPAVGQVGGSKIKNWKGPRLTVYTAASLHHSDFDADILLCDEAHELMADKSAALLARYQKSRNYAFSASPDGRLDGADIRMTALFGRTIFHIPYPEAVALGLVVPIRVEWTDVQLAHNPAAGLEDVHRKRRGIWQNEARNRIIADRVMSFGPEEQVLVLVETVEHMVYLRKHLPGFTMVYGAMEDKDWVYYEKEGLLPDNTPCMTPALSEQMRVEFESGRLKKVISTSKWKVGIDPVELVALVRADAAGSAVDDIQAPGRVSRTHAAGGKNVGIVVDFLDQFDRSLNGKAKTRHKHYAACEWEQVRVLPDGRIVPL